MITIRKATLKDATLVSQLLMKKYRFRSVREARKTFKEEYKIQHYRIARQENCVAGLLSWQARGTSEHGVAELIRLAVDDRCEDPGYVKEMLFDQFIAEADFYFHERQTHLRKVYSLIHADNKQIREFFERKGMHQEARLKSHFRQDTDELVFSLFFGIS